MSGISTESLSSVKLKPTSTTVTSVDGSRVVYTHGRDEAAGFVRLYPCDGYVVDTTPDASLCKVTEGLFIGSMDAARNLAELKANNITHIVNAAAGLENAFPDMFYYYNLNALDIYDFDMLSLLPDCVKWMESACPGGVFVHCQAGISRSATVVIAYLMYSKRMSLQEALELVKAARPAICPNNGFMAQLKKWEQLLKINKV